MKFTSVFFLGPFCLILTVFLLIAHGRYGFFTASFIILGSAVSIIPWAATYADKLNAWVWFPPKTTDDPAHTLYPSILNIFGSSGGFYGGTRVEYGVVIVVLSICFAGGVKLLLNRHRDISQIVNVAATIGAFSAFVGLDSIVDDEAALRFSIPFLIAVTPLTLTVNRDVLAFSKGGKQSGLWQKGFPIATAIFSMIVIFVFFGYGVQRVLRMARTHTVISFPVSPAAAALEREALSDKEKSYLRSLQEKVPEGATIWAWVDAPFHLDFARNRIWHFSHDWFIAPWRLRATNSSELKQELLSRNVDYILWQYRSPFVIPPQLLINQLMNVEVSEYRIIHRNTLDLLLALFVLRGRGVDIIYSDNRAVLIALKR
jgi:hypothetical protein